MPKGFFLPKPKTPPPPPPPKTAKITFPAEVWDAIEMAAKANETDAQSVIVHGLRHVLRHELATLKRTDQSKP